MAETRIQDRLGFILTYGVEGEDNLESLERKLSSLEEAGTNVNEQTKQARKIFEERNKAAKETEESTSALVQKQFDLSTAVSESNDIVKEVTLSSELLRLEYEEGNITQKEYQEGLKNLRGQLEGLQVQTLSSTRSMRSIASTQRQLEGRTEGLTGSVRTNMLAMNSFSRILTSLPRGIEGVSSQLPFLVRHMNRLGQSSRGGGSALRSLAAFIMSPAGIAVALASLIPLIIAANEKWDIFKTTLADTEKVGNKVAEMINKINKEFAELTTEDQVEALESELDDVGKQIENLENASPFGWMDTVLLPVGAFFENLVSDSEQLQELNTARKASSTAIAKLKEREAEIEAELLALRVKEGSETLKQKEDLTEILKVLDEMDKVIAGFEDMDILGTEEVISGDLTQELLDLEEEQANEMARIGNERLAFEKHINSLRFENRLASLEGIERIEAQHAERVRQIKENEALTDRQRMIALAELEKKLAKDVKDYKNQMALLEQQRRDQLWQNLADSFQGFGQVIAGTSEENARKAFRIDKALSLASATAFGAQAVVRAFARGGPKEAVLVGAAVAAQIAKILSTTFQGGQSGAANQQAASFRGQFSGLQGVPVSDVVPQTTVNVPNEFIIKDRAGELLTKLEQARSRQGGSPNLVS